MSFDRYPEVPQENLESLLLHIGNVESGLEQIFRISTSNNNLLGVATERLNSLPDSFSLAQFTDAVHKTFPMRDGNGNMHPLLTTQEQLNFFLDRQNIADLGVGDCKFLTIFSAYVFSKLQIPSVVSIRSYSGHPVLFAAVEGQSFKISYLHEKVSFREFNDDNPFGKFEESSMVTNLVDKDFQDDQQLLYFRIRNAIYVLDCMNLMRRAVVNVSLNEEKAKSQFDLVKNMLINSKIPYGDVIEHWKMEFERSVYMLEYLRDRTPYSESVIADIHKSDFIKSLRFI